MNLEKLCSGVVATVKKAGDFIRRESRIFTADRIEYKGHNNLVSYVDKEAEKMLVQELSALLPEAGFITEEGTAPLSTQTLNWVIDPLDGTTNFTHGFPVYAVSIGLTEGKKSLLGVVYDVTRDECFYGWQNGGAFCNGERLKLSVTRQLKDGLMATGFPYTKFDKYPQYMQILNHLLMNSHGIRRLGSAAIDAAYVACGRVDGFFEYGLNAWDIAGGVLLIEEAGGKVTDFAGGNDFIFGRSLVAGSTPEIQAELLEVVRKYW
jgi:myo-inositol-1(or 4)-monophosphatase